MGEIELDLKDLRAIVHNSFESRAKAGEPTCHFLSGFIAGVVSSVSDKEYKATEIQCISTGEESCVFVLEETKWFERVSKLVEAI